MLHRRSAHLPQILETERTVTVMKSPLAYSPIAVTTSPEETENLFTTELAQSRILKVRDNGVWGVEMDGVAIGNSALYFVNHRSNYEIDCGVIDDKDSTIFCFAVGQPACISFDGQPVDLSKNAVVVGNRSSIRHKRAAGSHEVLIKCRSQDIETRLQAIMDRSISNELLFECSVALDTGIGAHGKSTITYIMNSLKADPALLDNPLIAANFEELMIGVVLSMPNSYTDDLLASGGSVRAPGIVTQAEEFMEASAGLPITIADVLSHIGASRKALLANFRKFRGYSPSEFLVNARLKLAHQRLQDPSPTDSVTSIAYESGFSHMGRFSVIYRKRYGVSPSKTLKWAFRK